MIASERLTLWALALTIALCSNGCGPGNNVSSTTVTVLLGGAIVPGQVVVESTGYTPGTPGAPTGVLTSQTTDASGKTTFSGNFVSGQVCFSAISGTRRAFNCYSGGVPGTQILPLE